MEHGQETSKTSPLRIPNLAALRASSELASGPLSTPAVQVVSFNSNSHQAVVVPPPPPPSVALDKSAGVKVSLVHASSNANTKGSSKSGTMYKPVTITATSKSVASFDSCGSATRLVAPSSSSSAGLQPTVSVTLNPGPGRLPMRSVMPNPNNLAHSNPILVPNPNSSMTQLSSSGAPARVIGATRIVNLSSSIAPHTSRSSSTATTVHNANIVSKVVNVSNNTGTSNVVNNVGSNVNPVVGVSNAIPIARVIPHKPAEVPVRPITIQNLTSKVTPTSQQPFPLVVGTGVHVTPRIPGSVEVHTINKNSNYNHGATDLTTSSNVASIGHQVVQTVQQQKPGILRRRDGDKEGSGLPVRSLSQDDIHSSGSTTLSATSSPLADNDNALMIEDTPQEPSPRKKPRKQQLLPKDVNTSKANGNNAVVVKATAKSKAMTTSTTTASKPVVSTLKNRPASMSLMSSHRATWKPRHNHFIRHSDVLPKEEKRPTVNELAGQNRIEKKLCGWKVHHISTQMDDVVQVEKEFMHRLADLQRIIERKGSNGNSLHRDKERVQELIKANLQRSKVIQAQVQESKASTMKLFDHKPKVETILAKFAHRRQPRK